MKYVDQTCAGSFGATNRKRKESGSNRNLRRLTEQLWRVRSRLHQRNKFEHYHDESFTTRRALCVRAVQSLKFIRFSHADQATDFPESRQLAQQGRERKHVRLQPRHRVEVQDVDVVEALGAVVAAEHVQLPRQARERVTRSGGPRSSTNRPGKKDFIRIEI